MESSVLARAVRCATPALLLCVAYSSCSSDRISGGSGSAEIARLRDGLVVSGPLTPSYSIVRPSVSASRTALADTAQQLVYLSLSPGTLRAGDSVRIIGNGVQVSAPMADGGFDPVAIYASGNDSLAVEVFNGAQDIGPVFLAVPASRPPTVVRTSPPKGKRDVPLNQMIVIVFSQPIDPATLTSSSLQLTTGSATVPIDIVVQPNQPWVVRLQAKTLLAPGATYLIQIDGTVKDAAGMPIAAPVSSDFTTGSNADSVASVGVVAIGGYARRPSSTAIASPGGNVPFIAYKLAATGDTLTSNSGASVTWSTSDQSIATVDALGIATALAAGQATVTACAGTICGRGTIIVLAADSGIAPIDLGDLGGGDSRVYGMAGGYVVGFSRIASSGSGCSCHHAFVWTQALGMKDLGTLPGDWTSDALGVNESGVVIGYSYTSQLHSFAWTSASGMQRLADPDSANGPWRIARVNRNGDLAFNNLTGSKFAFRSAAGITSVNEMPEVGGLVSGLNASGQLAIYTYISDSVHGDRFGTTAYVVDGVSGQTLATLAPTDPHTGQPLQISVDDINDQGMVSGLVLRLGLPASTWADSSTAFRWTAAGGFTYLPPQGPGIGTRALFLNSAGDATVYFTSHRIVGTDTLFEGRSAVWLANGSLIMLGGLGGTHTFANGINDLGQAAGHSQVGSNTGPQHAVIWNYSSGAAAQRIPATPARRQPAATRAAAPKRKPPATP